MKTLYIVVTNDCQLQCPFCYTNFIPQFKENKTSNTINTDMVATLINNGLNGEKFDYVIFHGGEPLLYPNIINDILDKVKVNTSFSIQTNLAYKELSKEQLKVMVRLSDGYGTSYNVDRFENNKQAEEYFIHNIKELNSLGIDGTLLVTVTENQINKQNPSALYEYIKKLGIKKVVLERPILPLEKLKNERTTCEELYEEVDKYLMQCVMIFPKDMTNLFWLVEKSVNHGLTLYDTQCSNKTYTLYNDYLKYGCPSLEKRNVNNSEMKERCFRCKYYQYCGSDCECFNYVCAFPKRMFDYIKGEL